MTDDCELMKSRAAESDSGYTFRAVTVDTVTAETAAQEILGGLDLLFIPEGKCVEGQQPDFIHSMAAPGINGVFVFRANRPDMDKLFSFAMYLVSGNPAARAIIPGPGSAEALIEMLAEDKPNDFIEMMERSGACSRDEAESMVQGIKAQPKKIQ